MAHRVCLRVAPLAYPESDSGALPADAEDERDTRRSRAEVEAARVRVPDVRWHRATGNPKRADDPGVVPPGDRDPLPPRCRNRHHHRRGTRSHDQSRLLAVAPWRAVGWLNLSLIPRRYGDETKDEAVTTACGPRRIQDHVVTGDRRRGGGNGRSSGVARTTADFWLNHAVLRHGRTWDRTRDLSRVKRNRRVCAENAFSLNHSDKQGFLDVQERLGVRADAAFCAPAVGLLLDGVVARFANEQRHAHLRCICVSALLGFVGGAGC